MPVDRDDIERLAEFNETAGETAELLTDIEEAGAGVSQVFADTSETAANLERQLDQADAGFSRALDRFEDARSTFGQVYGDNYATAVRALSADLDTLATGVLPRASGEFESLRGTVRELVASLPGTRAFGDWVFSLEMLAPEAESVALGLAAVADSGERATEGLSGLSGVVSDARSDFQLFTGDLTSAVSAMESLNLTGDRLSGLGDILLDTFQVYSGTGGRDSSYPEALAVLFPDFADQYQEQLTALVEQVELRSTRYAEIQRVVLDRVVGLLPGDSLVGSILPALGLGREGVTGRELLQQGVELPQLAEEIAYFQNLIETQRELIDLVGGQPGEEELTAGFLQTIEFSESQLEALQNLPDRYRQAVQEFVSNRLNFEETIIGIAERQEEEETRALERGIQIRDRLRRQAQNRELQQARGFYQRLNAVRRAIEEREEGLDFGEGLDTPRNIGLPGTTATPSGGPAFSVVPSFTGREQNLRRQPFVVGRDAPAEGESSEERANRAADHEIDQAERVSREKRRLAREEAELKADQLREEARQEAILARERSNRLRQAYAEEAQRLVRLRDTLIRDLSRGGTGLFEDILGDVTPDNFPFIDAFTAQFESEFERVLQRLPDVFSTEFQRIAPFVGPFIVEWARGLVGGLASIVTGGQLSGFRGAIQGERPNQLRERELQGLLDINYQQQQRLLDSYNEQVRQTEIFQLLLATEANILNELSLIRVPLQDFVTGLIPGATTERADAFSALQLALNNFGVSIENQTAIFERIRPDTATGDIFAAAAVAQGQRDEAFIESVDDALSGIPGRFTDIRGDLIQDLVQIGLDPETIAAIGESLATASDAGIQQALGLTSTFADEAVRANEERQREAERAAEQREQQRRRLDDIFLVNREDYDLARQLFRANRDTPLTNLLRDRQGILQLFSAERIDAFLVGANELTETLLSNEREQLIRLRDPESAGLLDYLESLGRTNELDLSSIPPGVEGLEDGGSLSQFWGRIREAIIDTITGEGLSDAEFDDLFSDTRAVLTAMNLSVETVEATLNRLAVALGRGGTVVEEYVSQFASLGLPPEVQAELEDEDRRRRENREAAREVELREQADREAATLQRIRESERFDDDRRNRGPFFGRDPSSLSPPPEPTIGEIDASSIEDWLRGLGYTSLEQVPEEGRQYIGRIIASAFGGGLGGAGALGPLPLSLRPPEIRGQIGFLEGLASAGPDLPDQLEFLRQNPEVPGAVIPPPEILIGRQSVMDIGESVGEQTLNIQPVEEDTVFDIKGSITGDVVVANKQGTTLATNANVSGGMLTGIMNTIKVEITNIGELKQAIDDFEATQP